VVVVEAAVLDVVVVVVVVVAQVHASPSCVPVHTFPGGQLPRHWGARPPHDGSVVVVVGTGVHRQTCSSASAEHAAPAGQAPAQTGYMPQPGRVVVVVGSEHGFVPSAETSPATHSTSASISDRIASTSPRTPQRASASMRANVERSRSPQRPTQRRVMTGVRSPATADAVQPNRHRP
jgi:hypothetical protein